MFGRKGKVTITDAGVTVMGDVTIDDQRTKTNHNSAFLMEQEVKPVADWLRGRRWWIVEKDITGTLIIHDGKGNTALAREGEDVVLVGYHPTAEEARNIEPDIRENLVEESVKATLDEVVRASKEGLIAATVNYTPFMSKLCSTAERKRVVDKLKSLGYTYYNGTISWRK